MQHLTTYRHENWLFIYYRYFPFFNRRRAWRMGCSRVCACECERAETNWHLLLWSIFFSVDVYVPKFILNNVQIITCDFFPSGATKQKTENETRYDKREIRGAAFFVLCYSRWFRNRSAKQNRESIFYFTMITIHRLCYWYWLLLCFFLAIQSQLICWTCFLGVALASHLKSVGWPFGFR